MSSSSENMSKVKLGIYAMAKKASSLAMKNILENLEKFTNNFQKRNPGLAYSRRFNNFF